MVTDLLAPQRVAEASETVESRRPVDLSEWFTRARYLPEDLLLASLSEVDSELADRHRREGSAKQAVLRDVKARLDAVG